MAEPVRDDHFLPVRRADLVRRLLADPLVPVAERAGIAQVCAALGDLLHLETRRRAERLKELYAPLDPNRDTSGVAAPVAPVDQDQPPGDHHDTGADFSGALGGLLERANYRRISDEELERAYRTESVFRVRLHTRLDDFAELALHRRGLRRRQERVPRWFGLRSRPLEVDYFERVVMHVRFQDADHFDAKRRAKLAFKPGTTVLKLFENIPVADLEMIFPNSEVRMRLSDQLVLGVPALLGGFTILANLGTTLLFVAGMVLAWLGVRNQTATVTHAELVALGASLFTLAIFVTRQLARLRFRRLQFFKMLADSLYYRNLDNNAGVLHHLLDTAEEEEIKEAVLAYVFLRCHGACREGDLDATIESWFATALGLTVDFEVDDAVAKLERLGVASQQDGIWTALAPDAAFSALRTQWSGGLACGE